MNDKTAPEADVVLETRVSLLRNFADVPFDASMSDEEAMHNVARVNAALEEAGQRDAFIMSRLADMTASERGRLAEHGLIDRDLLKNAARTAAFLSKGATINIGVNGTEHVRIDAALQGFQLERTAGLAFMADDWLDGAGAYAYDEQFGYLTAEPILAGAGMIASVTLHLPALRASGQTTRLMRDMDKKGLSLKKRFEEKGDQSGLYRLSAAVKMGQTEEEALEALSDAALELIAAERAVRERILEQDKLLMEDRAGRSLALIGAARLMSATEMRERCSDIRLAAALELIDWPLDAIDRMLGEMSDASIECRVAEKLTERQRDMLRADALREAIGRLEGTA